MINDLMFSNIVLKQDLINDKDLRVCQKSSAVSSGMDHSWLVVLGLAALSDSISVYIWPSPREGEKEEKG